MTKRIFLIALIAIYWTIYASAQGTLIVQQYCENLASWASNKNIRHLHAMESLRSEYPSFRIGNKLINQLASKYNVPQTNTYEWDVYIPCIQKEVDKGIQISYSDIKAVPEEYIEQKYPGLQYVSCNINIRGSVTTELKDLFIIKDSKIVKIADYIEQTDTLTAKKSIKIDYLDLAKCAFADKDYQKCYLLYKDGGLKALHHLGYMPFAYDIFPFVESCTALSKWDEAMHGITNRHIITNRKTWVNGIEWRLDPEDLETWSKAKEPLMDYLLKKTFEFYVSKPTQLTSSPIINHVSKCRNISLDEIEEYASVYFWDHRRTHVAYLRAAAALGHKDAQKWIGIYYLTGRNTEPISHSNDSIACDTIKAIRYFEQAAAQGDVKSATIAAHLYLSGHGVKQDFAKAFSLYNMCASQNNFDKKYGLGLCYYYGYGVQSDIHSALFYLKDVEDWHAEVPYIIGNIYYADNQNPNAVLYYEKALKRATLNKSIRYSILINLSDCYRYGKCGLSVNISEADRLQQEAKSINITSALNINEYLISLTQISLYP